MMQISANLQPFTVLRLDERHLWQVVTYSLENSDYFDLVIDLGMCTKTRILFSLFIGGCLDRKQNLYIISQPNIQVSLEDAICSSIHG